ncbi:MAG: hypothetical protein ACPL07_01060 [Candidatus Bathyarchaeia archaeon]
MLKRAGVRGFVEIHCHINRENLHRMMENRERELRFNYKFSSLLRKTGYDVTIGLVECDFNGETPTGKETEFLFDLFNNPQLDILVPPIMRVTCENYVKFLDKFIEVYRTCSFRARLAPIILHYSSADISKLFEYYMKRDEFNKTLICVDFNGGNPVSQWSLVSLVTRESQVLEKEFGEPCVRYAINIKYGKATKKQTIVPAKDLTIFAMGFNLFGTNHKIVPIMRDVGEYELRTKLLNRTDYGYYSVEVAKDFIRDTSDYEVKLSDVLEENRLAKVFNAERHGLEALEISTAIREHRLADYLKSKQRLLEDQSIFKKIRKVNESIYDGKLSRYF